MLSSFSRLNLIEKRLKSLPCPNNHTVVVYEKKQRYFKDPECKIPGKIKEDCQCGLPIIVLVIGSYENDHLTEPNNL